MVAVRIAGTAAVQRDRVPRVDGRWRYCRRGHRWLVGIRHVENCHRGFHSGGRNCWTAAGDAQREFQRSARRADGGSRKHRHRCRGTAQRHAGASGLEPGIGRLIFRRLPVQRHQIVLSNDLIGRGNLCLGFARWACRHCAGIRQSGERSSDEKTRTMVLACQRAAKLQDLHLGSPLCIWGNYGSHDRCSA